MSEQDQEVTHKKDHHWKMRSFIAVLMLILSFVGLVVSDVRSNGAWNYWRWMVPIFACLCLFLSWYLRGKAEGVKATTIWHELVQWTGLALSVYVVSIFVNIGLLGRFEAGLVVLILLSLNIFITGIYVESTFFVIGVVLGLFAVGAALLAAYLYTIILPITVAIVALLIWMIRRKSTLKG